MARKSFALKWVKREPQRGYHGNLIDEWALIPPNGKVAALVWGNGTWHTFDEHKVGGENSVADSVPEARREAIASLFVQGWHGMSIEEVEHAT